MKSDFPTYPPKPHATGQARINIPMPYGERKAFYLGAHGTPRSHAVYAVMQQRYLESDGTNVISKKEAEAEAEVFITGLLHLKTPRFKRYSRWATTLCVIVVVWCGGVWYGRPDSADRAETLKPVLTSAIAQDRDISENPDPQLVAIERGVQRAREQKQKLRGTPEDQAKLIAIKLDEIRNGLHRRSRDGKEATNNGSSGGTDGNSDHGSDQRGNAIRSDGGD